MSRGQQAGKLWLLGALAIGGIGLTLAMTSDASSSRWSRDVDQLLLEKGQLAGRQLRVQGLLVEGSLHKREEPCEVRFKLTRGGAVLPVHYAGCVVPETFREVTAEALEVIVNGEIDPAGHFEASQVGTVLPRK